MIPPGRSSLASNQPTCRIDTRSCLLHEGSTRTTFRRRHANGLALAKAREGRANIAYQSMRIFQCCKVAALFVLGEVPHIAVALFDPAP